MAEENPAAQRQTTVTDYLNSEQLLLFVFAAVRLLALVVAHVYVVSDK